MSKHEKRILFILMPHDFQDLEFKEPYEILKNEGYKVDVAGLINKEIATGTYGYSCTPNKEIPLMKNRDFDQYDCLVIPGGQASTIYLWGNKSLQKIVTYFHKNKKIVATICYACIIQVQAGILEGKQATVFPTDESKKILKEHNVLFSNEQCVVLKKDKIITAQGPKAARVFGTSIVTLLKEI